MRFFLRQDIHMIPGAREQGSNEAYFPFDLANKGSRFFCIYRPLYRARQTLSGL